MHVRSKELIKQSSFYILLVTFIALTGCGGGSGNTTSSSPTTGSFIRSFGTVRDTANNYPFSSSHDLKTQFLYTSDEINGSGYINALHFNLASAQASVTCPNTTIRMGHTDLTTLTTTFANNVETGQGSLQTVLNNQTVSIPAGSTTEWFDIPLSTAFYYNGSDNLVIEIEKASACSGNTPLSVTNAAGRRAFSDAIDTIPGTTEHSSTTATNVDTNQIWMGFGFAGGDNNVAYSGSGGNAYPLSTTTSSNHVQMLHTASDINGSGKITGIAMIVDEGAVTDAANYTVNIKLGHTTLSTLTTSFANNFDSGSAVTVASGLTFSVPAGVPVGSPIWLPLTGSFNYNGTDNLIVDIEVTSASADTFWRYNNAAAGHRLYAAVGDVTGSVDTGSYDTIFRFNGGDIQVMPNTAASSGEVLGAGASGGQFQSLYRTSDIGSGGTINSVSVRLMSDSTATSLTNYKLYMGHTSKTALSTADSYASNMDNETLVYSGTLNVPAGLKAGDWLTIPLQTSFAYDTANNLCILFTSDLGAIGNNYVTTSTGATRYPNFSVGRNTNTGDTSVTPTWNSNSIVDIRLGISN